LVNLGNWRLDTVDGGSFSIDGGVVYGVVPKMLWEKATPPDACNRLRFRNNCVLARDGRHTVLIDTGYGGKHVPLDRSFYEMDAGEPLLESLASLGVCPDDIDTVVLSHLHFDHAGGATRYDAGRRLVPTFPRARHVIGRLEWEDAVSQAPELERAYPMENLEPLQQTGTLVLIDGDSRILPGLRGRLTGGHTRGHLALMFESGGQTALCIGDLCPTTAHLRRSWCMAYDTHLLQTRIAKPQFLAEAADGQWLVVWPHDPKVAAAQVVRHAKREFDVVAPMERL
jgi:glyoxylase-like metal-dependent hydrolase (beta-lactamase superfamily II)